MCRPPSGLSLRRTREIYHLILFSERLHTPALSLNRFFGLPEQRTGVTVGQFVTRAEISVDFCTAGEEKRKCIFFWSLSACEGA